MRFRESWQSIDSIRIASPPVRLLCTGTLTLGRSRSMSSSTSWPRGVGEPNKHAIRAGLPAPPQRPRRCEAHECTGTVSRAPPRWGECVSPGWCAHLGGPPRMVAMSPDPVNAVPKEQDKCGARAGNFRSPGKEQATAWPATAQHPEQHLGQPRTRKLPCVCSVVQTQQGHLPRAVETDERKRRVPCGRPRRPRPPVSSHLHGEQETRRRS